jgi:acyl-coenzyme A thioesterase PaaI-like protein
VLAALAANRTPGFNFPGHFLELSYERVARGEARVSLEGGAHCADADGQVNVGALALLADMALASSMRSAVGASARLATVSMSLQLSGEPRTGTLKAVAKLDGFLGGVAEKQGLARVEVRSGRKLVCTGSGAFMQLDQPTAPHPLPRRGSLSKVALPDVDHLNAAEEAVYTRARKAAAAGLPFLAAFWGYAPRKNSTGATCIAPNGMHIGNRVGHAQGGVTFGLACSTAIAALPAGWRLAGASAWYIGPGIGTHLKARSTVLHQGLLTAVVHTRIENDEKRGVLECVTSHARKMVSDTN